VLIPLAVTLGEIAELVGAVATFGLLLAACAAGILASRQLGQLKEQITLQRKTEGRRRVFEHLAQLFDRDFIEMDTEAQRLFKARPKDPDGWETLWEAKSDDAKFRVASAMNFYEVIAGDYNDPEGEVLDRATADRALAYIADAMWVLAKPFVYWLREHFKNDRAYAEWEQLHLIFTQRQAVAGVAAPTPASRAAGSAAAGKPPQPPAAAKVVQAQTGGGESAQGHTTAVAAAQVPPSKSNDCPEDPCVVMPKAVLVVAILWIVLLIAAFFSYIEIHAVAHFFPHKVGGLPFSTIWFGAVGGLLISLEGIFKYNRRWLRSYDYWHYLRPVLGAIMGTLGCLVFTVLTAAAAASSTPTPNAAFYAVVALALGYREQSFRELLTRLVDTVIMPPQKEAGKDSSATTGASS
jgi:hypothetical protein